MNYLNLSFMKHLFKIYQSKFLISILLTYLQDLFYQDLLFYIFVYLSWMQSIKPYHLIIVGCCNLIDHIYQISYLINSIGGDTGIWKKVDCYKLDHICTKTSFALAILKRLGGRFWLFDIVAKVLYISLVINLFR